MRLNSAKKLIPEDFPEKDYDLVRRLADALNPFIFSVFTAISKQITLYENLKAQTFTISLDAGESTKDIKYDLNERPSAVFIGNALKSDSTQVNQAITVSWVLNQGSLNVKFIGLDASTKYRITLIAQV
jgi:hypothetical protein